MKRIQWVVTALLLVTMACGRPDRDEAGRTSEDTAAGSMGMSMAGMQMIPGLRAHLDSLTSLSPAGMSATMAAHQDLASRMLDAMGTDMRGMNLPADSAWVALGDSVRRDLAELPTLSGDDLKARMAAHAGRMRRMMAAHESMMSR